MGRVKNTLITLILAGATAFSGCAKTPPSGYVEGKVIKEFGSAAGIVESSGALFGNESVKINEPTYGIKVDTPKGIYTIEFDDQVGSPGPRTILNLAGAIEEGTRVRFPTKNVPERSLKPTGFTNDRIGTLDPDDIEVLYNK